MDGELGSPVVRATTVLGGFSPGAAARLVCADGSRAFVKAAGTGLNPDTPELNRREIAALRVLPSAVPHARILDAYDDGDWVGLLLEDVSGHRPALPWTQPDVAAMSAALAVTAATTAPETLPPFAEVSQALSGWDAAATAPKALPTELAARLPEMLDRQALACEVTRGDSLVHWDARNDNVIVRDGEAVLLDWAWACRGAPWIDTLLLAMDFVIQGGPDPEQFLEEHAATSSQPRDHLAALLYCLVGLWFERASRPAPPGLPTIRPWQAHCAEKTYAWLDGSSWWR